MQGKLPNPDIRFLAPNLFLFLILLFYSSFYFISHFYLVKMITIVLTFMVLLSKVTVPCSTPNRQISSTTVPMSLLLCLFLLSQLHCLLI